MFYQTIVKPALFWFDTERAHNSTINFAKYASQNATLKKLARYLYYYESELLNQEIWKLHFSNPVGLAAGFDKNGVAAKIFAELGFGFVEVGSITAHPSSGNPLPRSFRLPEDFGLINRMGLNNDGAEIITQRLSKINIPIPLGINIAKTHDPNILDDMAVEDYLFSFRQAESVADYITLNISCPNTSEGKTFEDEQALNNLLQGIQEIKSKHTPPILVKFSVDLERKELEKLVSVCEKNNVDGYVATNTSLSRKGLKADKEELRRIGKGGLSGRPIARRSTQLIAWLFDLLQGSKPIIGVGGIDSLESALDKLKAGADLLQVYTGLIYKGPGLVSEINRGLAEIMNKHNLSHIRQIREIDLH